MEPSQQITRKFLAPTPTDEIREALNEADAFLAETFASGLPVAQSYDELLANIDSLESLTFPEEYLRLKECVRTAEAAVGSDPQSSEAKAGLSSAVKAFNDFERGPGLESNLSRHANKARLQQMYIMESAGQPEYAAAHNSMHQAVTAALQAIAAASVPAAERAIIAEITAVLAPHYFDLAACEQFARQSPLLRVLHGRRSANCIGMSPGPTATQSRSELATQLRSEIADLLAGTYEFSIGAEPPKIHPIVAAREAAVREWVAQDNVETRERIEAAREIEQTEKQLRQKVASGMAGGIL